MDLDQQRVLLNQIRKNPKQFGTLYDLFASRIFSYALKRCRSYDAARDITSEVFLKAFLNIRRFQWQGKDLLIWFYRIAQNELKLYFRNERRYLKAHSYLADVVQPSVEQERIRLEEEVEMDSKLSDIMNKIQTLPEKERECIYLHYLESFTYSEISEITGIKSGTVKSHISRGMTKLRNT